MSEKYELLWNQEISKHIKKLKLPKEEFLKLKKKLTQDNFLEKPVPNSKRLKGMTENIRYIRFQNYRVFILINEPNSTIVALTIYPRKECYKSEKLVKIESLANEFK